jgi:hypothetical protein
VDLDVRERTAVGEGPGAANCAKEYGLVTVVAAALALVYAVQAVVELVAVSVPGLEEWVQLLELLELETDLGEGYRGSVALWLLHLSSPRPCCRWEWLRARVQGLGEVLDLPFWML